MKLLGLMSGTSLDGIDAVLLQVEEGEGGGVVLGWEILSFHTRPYGAEERDGIRRAMEGGGAQELAHLHTRLGEWFAEAVLELLEGAGVSAAEVAAVGSHGQTVWHTPPSTHERGSSLQLGCPATLAERTGIGVVSDFRSRDLAAGGHGAPLVPWADRVFFSSPNGPRALQNLGGMGNVTWLPRTGDPTPLLAFDTGPGVVLLDAAAELATAGAWAFDREGELARQGEINETLLLSLLSNPFFQLEPPRSTGRELFGPAMVLEAIRALEEGAGRTLVPGSSERGWPDLLATLTAVTARSIGEAYRRFLLPRGVEAVYLTGGGARNPALAEAIREELAPLPVLPGEELGMDPDAREAAAFALMAWAHLRRVPANVPEGTGSSGPRVLGSWTPGRGDGSP